MLWIIFGIPFLSVTYPGSGVSTTKSLFDAEEGSSWDVVNEKDLWDGEAFKLDQDDYVLVRQEDIVDGIACYMAACLLSLKDTKVCALLLQLPLNLYAFKMSSFGHTQNPCFCIIVSTLVILGIKQNFISFSKDSWYLEYTFNKIMKH